MKESPHSPLATPEPWGMVADTYALEVAPMFETFAREALRLAKVTRGMRVVDIAAGPGTLAVLAARDGAAVSALDFAPEMIAHLRERVRAQALTNLETTLGDGMDLPYADASFDAGFSMFGLMFFPDRARGFAELSRVLRPGARAVVSSWVDYSTVPQLAAAFGVMAELTAPPGSAPAPARPLPLGDPRQCREEMRAAGFSDVAITEHVSTWSHASTGEMLDSMVRTSAPLLLLQRSLGDRWNDFAARWREGVGARLGNGPQDVAMAANMISGVR